jgi:hypothetical protein
MQEKEDDDVNIESIPFLVSLHDLMCLYDRLLAVANAPVAIPSAFSKLRLVCSVLNEVPFRWSQEQRDTIESTCRRAHLLEILLMSDNHMTNDASSSFWIPVEIVPATLGGSQDVFEWKYRYLSEVSDGSDDNELPIVSISKEELMEEEALLLQMAHTPIPTEVAESHSNRMSDAVTNTGAFHRETMQHRIRDLWGESMCQQIEEQLRKSNLEKIAK